MLEGKKKNLAILSGFGVVFFKILIWKSTSKNELSIKASSIWLCLTKTSATKDLSYNRRALKHKSNVFFPGIGFNPTYFFSYYNYLQFSSCCHFSSLPSRALLVHSQEHFFRTVHWTFIFPVFLCLKTCLFFLCGKPETPWNLPYRLTEVTC